jgi:hypothetical protein
VALSSRFYRNLNNNYEVSHGVWMRLADVIMEFLVGSILRSSKNILIIVNDWVLCLYRNYGDRGGGGVGIR